ncbi:MAG: phage scaffolding protein [Candidatus Limnocylindrales bacterium]
MTTETTSAGAMPAVAGATPAQSDPVQTGSTGSQTGATQPATGSTTHPGDSTLGDPGKRAIDSERTARAEAEKRAKSAEDELKKLRDANLSDAEKRDKRLVELEREQLTWQRERQEITLSSSVERIASRLGFADPADALGLLDHSAIEFEDTGAPKNLDALLGALLKAKPYLAAASSRASGSYDQGVRGGPQGGAIFTTTQVGDRAFWNANKDEIMRAMAEGRVREG